MRYAPIGSSGIEASVVALGTWAIGGWMWGGRNDDAAVRAIQAALDEGITLIDTAPVYGFGLSEEIIGKAIRGRRDQVIVATKCGLVWDGRGKGELFFASDEDGVTDTGGYKVHRYLGPESIQREVEASLRRLGVECIDLYQTHWQDSTTPIAETMDALCTLKKQGKIRAIGVSNCSPEQMAEYRSVGPIDAAQEQYNMLERGIEQTILPAIAGHTMALLAYSPMAGGLLTGKITNNHTFGKGDDRLTRPLFAPKNLSSVNALLAAIRPVADRHRATLGQLAVAWTIAQPGCTHALVGARTPEQAIQNAYASDIMLTADDLAIIDDALAAHPLAV